MNKLEEQIRANKLIFQKKLENKNALSSKNESKIKAGFSNSWDKGWANYGKASIEN